VLITSSLNPSSGAHVNSVKFISIHTPSVIPNIVNGSVLIRSGVLDCCLVSDVQGLDDRASPIFKQYADVRATPP